VGQAISPANFLFSLHTAGFILLASLLSLPSLLGFDLNILDGGG
jgi:hypothetical protein